MTWARQQAQISRLFYSANQKSIKILATEHPIIIIIIVFIILGYFHSIITPLFVKPDEEWHFAYIAHIRQTGSLPTAMERTKYEGYQAPFYYLLAALLSSPFHLEDINLLYNPNPHFLSTIKGNYNLFSPCPAQAAHVAYLARFLSLFFGAIIVGTTYQIGKIFFPKDVALMGSAGIAFLPTFLFITTAVSNDAAVIAFTTLASLVAVRIIMEGFTIKRGLLFGFFAGMATLSKLNGLILFASVPYLILASPGSLQRKIKEGFIYFIGLFVPFPWFVRNWILFGDPFNLYGLSPRPENIHPDMWEMITFIWKSFWLDFSVGRLVYGPSWIYWFYGFVFGLGIVGVLSLIFTHSAKNKILSIVGFFFLQAILILILQLLFSIRHFVGGGRYLLVVAAGWMILIAAGVKRILPYRYTSLVWCLMMFCLTIFAFLRVLIPNYYPAIIKTSVNSQPVGVLEDRIALVRFKYNKQTIHPGEEMTVEIAWKALRPIQESYSVFVQLVGRVGETERPLAQVDTYPGMGYYPTCRWRVGEVVLDYYYLRLPQNIPASVDKLRLIAGMYRFQTMERLKAYWWRDGHIERAYQDAFTLGFIELRFQEPINP